MSRHTPTNGYSPHNTPHTHTHITHICRVCTCGVCVGKSPPREPYITHITHKISAHSILTQPEKHRGNAYKLHDIEMRPTTCTHACLVDTKRYKLHDIEMRATHRFTYDVHRCVSTFTGSACWPPRLGLNSGNNHSPWRCNHHEAGE